MIVDVYHLLTTSTGGHRETYELRVQADTNPTLVSVICDAWMSRNNRTRSCCENKFNAKEHCKPYRFQYSELAEYETRQSIAQQGFCIKLADSFDTALHLSKVQDTAGMPSVLHRSR